MLYHDIIYIFSVLSDSLSILLSSRREVCLGFSRLRIVLVNPPCATRVYIFTLNDFSSQTLFISAAFICDIFELLLPSRRRCHCPYFYDQGNFMTELFSSSIFLLSFILFFIQLKTQVTMYKRSNYSAE